MITAPNVQTIVQMPAILDHLQAASALLSAAAAEQGLQGWSVSIEDVSTSGRRLGSSVLSIKLCKILQRERVVADGLVMVSVDETWLPVYASGSIDHFQQEN